MTDTNVTVERIDWDDVDDELRREMLRINLASRRQCPFFTPEYIDASLAHSEEYARDEVEPFLLVVRREERVIGVLPLRRRWNKASVPFRHIELIAASEVDLPDIISSTEDEHDAAEAIMAYLPQLLSHASAVYLPKLSAESALFPHRESARRRWAPIQEGSGMPVSHIPVVHACASEYFANLSKRMRSNVSRLGRRLAAAGRVEMLSASSSNSLSALFDVYLQLEDRSWKRGTEAAIRRSDQRVEMLESLFATAGAIEHHIDLITLDDEPVAGLISMSMGSSSFLMETCYDERFSEFSPSNLLIFLAVERAIRAGNTEVSLHGHFDYYKHRWLAEVVETCDVRLVRAGSVPHLSTEVGAAARRLMRRAKRDTFIPCGHRDSTTPVCDPWPHDVLEAASAAGDVIRLDTSALGLALPFDLAAS